jgi:hypothetical protein
MFSRPGFPGGRKNIRFTVQCPEQEVKFTLSYEKPSAKWIILALIEDAKV